VVILSELADPVEAERFGPILVSGQLKSKIGQRFCIPSNNFNKKLGNRPTAMVFRLEGSLQQSIRRIQVRIYSNDISA
jgi:hypothetical protein